MEAEYDLRVTELDFLPLGADENTAVYRILSGAGTAYFLKLRKNFDETIVRVPLVLKEQGVQPVIIPLEARSKRHYADFGEYKIILYPFVEGQDGFERELTDQHRQYLGGALKGIHSTQIPPELKNRIPQETYSPQWRELLKSFQLQIESNIFQ